MKFVFFGGEEKGECNGVDLVEISNIVAMKDDIMSKQRVQF